MQPQEPLSTIIIPKLPPCPICQRHNNRLVRVDVFNAKAEYYLYCEECHQPSWVMIGILCPELQRKDDLEWLDTRVLSVAEMLKSYEESSNSL